MNTSPFGDTLGRLGKSRHNNRAVHVAISIEKTLSASPRDRRIQVAIGLLRSDLVQSGRVSLIAKRLNISTSRLRHLFKEELGLPPSRYLKLARLQAAHRLLLESFLSVKEVTTAVGIVDVSHFVRDYKQLYGETPTQTQSRTEGNKVV
jgi:transcriptional regulator GlxA family with amidase domain